MSTAKDLTKEPPASPRFRVGGYPLLARAADKGRSAIAGTVGDYHFNCPLDNMLFGFKEVKGEDVKKLLEAGSTNEEIAAWLDANGAPKSPAEVQEWTSGVEALTFHGHPEKGDWFDGECRALGLDPAKTTLFEFLEADDKTIGSN